MLTLFRIVVVQEGQRNLQKSVGHEQCCSLFTIPVAEKIRKVPNRNIRLLSRVFTTAGGKQNPPAISRELTASFSLETTPVFTYNMI